MAEIILDFNERPPVTTYNHHAFGTGIISSYESGMNWIYDNYIDLSYYPANGPLTFEFYMDYIYCQPVFDRENISDDMLSVMKYNITELIENAIRHGKYFICCVDEYYIPDREASGLYHFNHNLLIYGMDSSRKIWYTAGYNESGKFGTQELPYKTVKAASPNMINILTLRKDTRYKLHDTHIDNMINQYNKVVPAERLGAFPEEGQLTGMEAVDRLLDDICDMANEKEPVDMRPVNLLYEHRRLMTLREPDNERYAAMLSQADILKKRIMIYNMRRADKDIQAVCEAAAQIKGQRL